jgi:putative ABC transport system permease protein
MGELRHAVRVLRATPGFTALAVIMLALGTGANAAVFSVIDGVLLRSPFERSSEIARVLATMPDGRTSGRVPIEMLKELASLHPTVTAVSTYTIGSPIVTRVDEPRRAQVECVPASMSDVLGTRPLMGRWFTAAEDTPAGPPVALVSYAFWRGVLKSDPNVLGRWIALDEAPVMIIGVMPKGFDGALTLRNRDIWAPVGQMTGTRAAFGCRPIGPTAVAFVRVGSGQTLDQASRAINAAIQPKSGSGPGRPSRIDLTSLSDETVGDLKRPFIALVGAVLAVLLIACANVANLGLARSLKRRREFAVRLALGATRSRIVRQTITENLIVAAAGAIAGLGLARVAMDAMVAILPRSLPYLATVELNVRVLGASLGITLLAAVLVGLLPAILGSAVRPGAGLREDERTVSGGGGRLRWTLVGAELALGVMLLVGALLMIRTFLVLRPSAPGFEPANKLFALVRLPTPLTKAEKLAFVEETARRLRGRAGITDIAATTYLPMSRNVDIIPLSVEGSTGEVSVANVTPSFITLMKIAIVRGRSFGETDTPNAPAVALVNEAFVRRWLSGREPLGAVVTVGSGAMAVPRQIVGVVADTRFTAADTRARAEVYLPFGQEILGNPYLIVGTADGRPATYAAAAAVVREVVAAVRPNQLVDRLEPYETLLSGEVATPRFGAFLLGSLALLAILLGAGGLGSALAWSVAERRREIGIRMALGAGARQIRQLILWRTLRIAAVAIAAGLLGARLASGLLEGWIYGVARTDVMTYIVCAMAMLAVSAIAVSLPTERAARANPVETLRAQ